MRWRLYAREISTDASLTGLGKTMQTIALICTDDTGEGVLPEPEDPDEEYDDMTLIGAFALLSLRLALSP